MTRHPRGFALAAALAAVIVLAALAALASIAARASLRESAALADETQSAESRANLRTRATRVLERVPLAQLLLVPRLLGQRDTLLAVTPAAWPWHRVVVSAGGAPVTAEFARANEPALPWCAAAVAGGVALISSGTLSTVPADACGSLLSMAAGAMISVFSDSLNTNLALPQVADTVVVASVAETPAIFRARRLIVLEAGASTVGIVIAPVVRLAAGAVHRGVIIASETLIVAAGGAGIADTAAVTVALRAFARIRSVGRSGLLLPP